MELPTEPLDMCVQLRGENERADEPAAWIVMDAVPVSEMPQQNVLREQAGDAILGKSDR